MMIAANDPSSLNDPCRLRDGGGLEPSFHSHATHVLMSRLFEESAVMDSQAPGLDASPPPASSGPAMRLRPFQRIGEYRLIARRGRGEIGRAHA